MRESARRQASLGFLFDEHVNRPALDRLRVQGVDAVHVTEVGLAGADDAAIIRWAQREGRIIVTRNYRDFAPLANALARRKDFFPGVLFFSASVPQGDIDAHVRSLIAWITTAAAGGTNPVQNSYAWLR